MRFRERLQQFFKRALIRGDGKELPLVVILEKPGKMRGRMGDGLAIGVGDEKETHDVLQATFAVALRIVGILQPHIAGSKVLQCFAGGTHCGCVRQYFSICAHHAQALWDSPCRQRCLCRMAQSSIQCLFIVVGAYNKGFPLWLR